MPQLDWKHLVALAMTCATWAYVATQMTSCNASFDDQRSRFWAEQYRELKQSEAKK
jgi:hypothetical protein